jgi:inosine-uridine nucleoside N-ribohydrolase
VWAFTNIKTIKQIAQPLEKSLVFIESVHGKDVLFLVGIEAHTAELTTSKLIVEFLSKWVWVFFNTKAINGIAQK